MLKDLIKVNPDDLKTNARIRLLPDEFGEYKPYEMLVFERSMFVPSGWEREPDNVMRKPSQLELALDELPPNDLQTEENRRKSYNRARNNLFNLLMCTTTFDSFVTLTLDESKVDRFYYADVVKRLGIWCDNRVRRHNLSYVLVPERHKNGAIHFHGMVNQSALKCVRARSPYNNRLMYDSKNRPIFNITDYPYGFTTLIPLSGEHAREATAKYCYKYITKSHGEKVGGRYYLSGGELGRPRYEYLNVDYSSIDGTEYNIGGGVAKLKKYRFLTV